jgi:threonine/homoserine/homoserine lactone efflux protein
MFVLRTGAEHGILSGLRAVTGVVLVDAVYIALAGLGVTQWSNDKRVRAVLQWAGAFVISGFGIDIILSAQGVHLIPAFTTSSQAVSVASPFVAGFLLTAANPLTILFWAGVFGAKVTEQCFSRSDIWSFSFGCLLATVCFMGTVSVAGAIAGKLLSATWIATLNTIVGCALVYFATRLALRSILKQNAEEI